jgi:hypothetical protein
MSRESVELIIGKVMLDAGFRDILLADPEKALEGFDLTQDEIACLKIMDAETMDSLANILDTRLLKKMKPAISTESGVQR